MIKCSTYKPYTSKEELQSLEPVSTCFFYQILGYEIWVTPFWKLYNLDWNIQLLAVLGSKSSIQLSWLLHQRLVSFIFFLASSVTPQTTKSIYLVTSACHRFFLATLAIFLATLKNVSKSTSLQQKCCKTMFEEFEKSIKCCNVNVARISESFKMLQRQNVEINRHPWKENINILWKLWCC